MYSCGTSMLYCTRICTVDCCRPAGRGKSKCPAHAPAARHCPTMPYFVRTVRRCFMTLSRKARLLGRLGRRASPIGILRPCGTGKASDHWQAPRPAIQFKDLPRAILIAGAGLCDCRNESRRPTMSLQNEVATLGDAAAAGTTAQEQAAILGRVTSSDCSIIILHTTYPYV